MGITPQGEVIRTKIYLMRNPYTCIEFQNPSFKTIWMDKHTDKPKPNAPHFFQSCGHKKSIGNQAFRGIYANCWCCITTVKKVSQLYIMLTRMCTLYPLGPHFHILKQSCTGLYLYFLSFLLNRDYQKSAAEGISLYFFLFFL